MDLFDAARQRYAVYLQEIRAKLQAEQYQVVTVVAEGEAATEILKAGQNSGADLIAMSTRGHSGLKRWALGSVAEHVLQGANVPVLLIREPRDRTHETIQHILVPLDGSVLAEQALPYAQRLAQTNGAKLLLLQAIDPAEAEFYGPQRSLAHESDLSKEHGLTLAHDYLQSVCHRLQATGLTCGYKVLSGIPHQTICQTVKRRHIDMVVMSTHGSSGLRRWLFGGVANHVIRGVSCPVLIVRDLPT